MRKSAGPLLDRAVVDLRCRCSRDVYGASCAQRADGQVHLLRPRRPCRRGSRRRRPRAVGSSMAAAIAPARPRRRDSAYGSSMHVRHAPVPARCAAAARSRACRRSWGSRRTESACSPSGGAVTTRPSPVSTSISSTDSCGQPLRNDDDSMPRPVTAPPSVIVLSCGTTSGIRPYGSVGVDQVLVGGHAEDVGGARVDVDRHHAVEAGDVEAGAASSAAWCGTRSTSAWPAGPARRPGWRCTRRAADSRARRSRLVASRSSGVPPCRSRLATPSHPRKWSTRCSTSFAADRAGAPQQVVLWICRPPSPCRTRGRT